MSGKLINFRAFAVVAVFVTCTALSVYCYMYFSTLGLILGVAAIAVVSALFAVFTVKFVCNRTRLVVPMAFGVAVVLSVCAFILGIVYCNMRQAGRIDGYCGVSGRVCAVDTQSGEYRVDIDNIKINGKTVDGGMRIDFYLSDGNAGELVRCGDILTFGADVRFVELKDKDGLNGWAYRSDIRYRATVYSDDLVQKFGKPKPIEGFLMSLRRLLTENMGEKYGNIAFSVLTGDKHSLNTGVYGYFNAAGVGHILAVSGLHIGFLVMLLNLILCKLNKKIRFPIIAVVLIAYNILADFSPSIMRATLMAFVAGIGILIGGRRDVLSSLSFAYSLILAFKPLYLFEVGFLLSFGSIFGIALFSRPIARLLEKCKVPKKISSAIGGSIGASIGIFPAEAYFFGTVHYIAFLVNIIVIPYMSIVFSVLFLSLFIAAIPVFAPILTVSKYLFVALDHVARGVAAIPYAYSVLNSAWQVILCYPIMFMSSEYVMYPKKCKTAVKLYSAAACIAIFVVCVL